MPHRIRGACSIEGCDKPHCALTWCRMHYARYRNNGDPLVTRMPNRGSSPKVTQCQVDGCQSPRPYVRGLCVAHYRRWKRYGDPVGEFLPAKRFPCTVEGCERNIEARGFCTMHYSRWQEGRDIGDATPLRAPAGAGHTDTHGYRVITVAGVKIKEHRYVMEQMLSRALLPREDVHHRNGVRTDNRPENLELWVYQPRGQRVEDLVAFVIDRYRDEVLRALVDVEPVAVA